MDAHAIVAALGLYAGALAVGALSSAIPIIAIDLFIVAAVMAGAAPVPVVVLAAAGQVAGKLPIYYATRGAAALPGPQRARIEWLRSKLDRWRRAPHAVLATSAVVGLPPFSLVATVAGALAIRVRAFCAIVFAGRAARFAIIAAATALAAR